MHSIKPAGDPLDNPAHANRRGVDFNKRSELLRLDPHRNRNGVPQLRDRFPYPYFPPQIVSL